MLWLIEYGAVIGALPTENPIDDAKPEWRALRGGDHCRGDAEGFRRQETKPTFRIVFREVIPQIIGISTREMRLGQIVYGLESPADRQT